MWFIYHITFAYYIDRNILMVWKQSNAEASLFTFEYTALHRPFNEDNWCVGQLLSAHIRWPALPPSTPITRWGNCALRLLYKKSSEILFVLMTSWKQHELSINWRLANIRSTFVLCCTLQTLNGMQCRWMHGYEKSATSF